VFLGGVPASELAELYRLADAFVYPSEREGFGLPPLEAMACGTPTIALRASSVPEVVGDGAILMDRLDVGAWAGAVRTVLQDPDLRADLARRGLERAAGFSWTRCARQTVDVYRRLGSTAGPS
jgi:glycosyltransferase involved in cell wall biosynthesis